MAEPLASALPAGSASPPGLSPATIKHAYGIDSIKFGSTTGDGSGQTIAIITAYDNPRLLSSSDPNFSTSDLRKFDAQFGLPDPPSFRKVDQHGGTSYPGPSPTWANEAALDVEWAHAVAPKANLLLVEAPSATTWTDLIAGPVSWARQQPGVSVISLSFAGGEFSGETSYDSYLTTPSGHQGITFVAAAGDNGAAAMYPTVSPNVIGVGGTRITLSGSSYVSESVWGSSGGGISTYESKPSYQSGVTQSSSKRTVPDVAFDADPNFSGVSAYDSYNGGGSTPWYKMGGTSLGAPVWAGLIAITNQGRALQGKGSLEGRSQTLPTLYSISGNDFHDITGGGNGGFAAGPGYDLITGRGTPKANTLVPDLGGLAQSPPSPASIAGNLFNDSNGNAKRDSGEPNLANRTFYIDANKNGKFDSGEKTAKADSSGNYKFSSLAAGTYVIREQIPSGWRVSLPTTTWSQTIAVSAGQNRSGVNFADTQKVLISGNVFNDSNGNKTKGSGESALSGWRVYIDSNNDGKYESNEASTLTDSSGNYKFTTLSAGSFHLRVTPPSGVSGYSATTPSGGVYTFTLAGGGLAMNKNFGERKA
ncbi:MAG TPA: SdrD B-like domain-containing protein [Tepidisphaeraceae bacterium]|nr:SdrD B-like domain-containing protein [Tepidisphaeraceae bacterium]